MAALRKEGGAYLRQLRERRGLSQRELAKLIGVQYYTFISQLETGRGRIPPDSYRVWARALKVNCRTFVRSLLGFYDPITYEILFGEAKVQDAVNDDAPEALETSPKTAI